MPKNWRRDPNKRLKAQCYITSLAFIIFRISTVTLITNTDLWVRVVAMVLIELLVLIFVYNFFVFPHMKIVRCIYDQRCTWNKKESVYEILEDIIHNHYQKEQSQQQLIDELTHMNEKISQNEKITRGMMSITSEILSYGNINVLLQMILEKAIELIPNAQKGSILVLEGEEFSFHACVGYDFEILKKVKLKLEETFQYKMGGMYEPCIVTNIEKFNKSSIDREKLSIMDQKNILQAKSVLSCAIIIKGKVYGTINLDNIEDEAAFCQEDKLVIKHLADQIGLALRNAQLVDEMLMMSRLDGLTKVYNRRYFEELLEKHYDIAKRYRHIFTICTIDLNDLKQINDTYGHAAGDQLLACFASIVQNNIRKTDIFARIGGDEFVIVFLNTNASIAHHVVKKIQKVFKQNPLMFEKQEKIVSFAYGICEYPNESDNIESMLKMADDRMYIDKSKVKSTGIHTA